MLLTKDIIPVGTYNVRSNKGPIRKTFTKEYLEKLAGTANKMIDSGLNIPAPFDHKKDATPAQVNTGSTTSYNNAGYWKHLWVADKDGIPTLTGMVDAAGEKDDPKSPAYKALNTNKEVSISVNDKYTDGLGREWEDATLHIALVNHAVVPGQDGFKEVPDGSLVVNMSMQVDDDGSEETLIQNLIPKLREAADIVVPDGTTAKTFLRDLLVAVSQLQQSKPVGDSALEPVPIYMSTGDPDMALTQKQAEALVASKAVNPDTSKPFTMEDFGFKKAEAPTSVELSTLQSQLKEKEKKLETASTTVQALVNKIVEDTKSNIQTRINALVAAGKVTKDYADSNLIPKVEFQMSVSDGKIADHPLEILLSGMEAMPSADTGSSNPSIDDATVQPLPFNDGQELTSEQIEEGLKEFTEFLV